jgi:hypothetical protein
MFNWYSIGVAIALASFVGVFVGYGLHCFLHDRRYIKRRKKPMQSPAAYDACEEPTDDDAVARRLLNY